MIEAWTASLPYANALALEVLRVGAQPMLLYQDEPTYWAAATGVSPKTLGRLGAHLRAAAERTDVLISFFGPSDRERFHALPRRIMLPLCDQRDALFHAAEKAGARAVDMAIGRLSPASARMYGMDLARWRDELVEGTIVDPRALGRDGHRLAAVLKAGRELSISHPNGTELRLGLRQRAPEVMDGRVLPGHAPARWGPQTLPAGVVTVALDERSAEGVFRSNVPNSVGVSDSVGSIVGGEWTFRAGRLVGNSYLEGGDLFEQSYRRAGRGRERPATISIGLNPRIDQAPLLQDQARGTLCLQIGRNDHVGGTNRVGWWAWLLLRGADLRVDGKRIVAAGSIGE